MRDCDIKPLRNKRCNGKSISQTEVTLKHCSEARGQTVGHLPGTQFTTQTL